MKLYPYQKIHVKRLTEILITKRGALDLSATGTGKTICALMTAKKLGMSAAVVCPLAAVPGWTRTAAAQKVPLEIKNYESVSKLVIPDNALVIYDEVHKCKNHKTRNARTMLLTAKGRKLLALSATIAHHAEHLRALNEAFRFTYAESFSGFMRECGYHWMQTRWAGEWVPDADSLEKTRRVTAPFTSAMTLADAAALFKENSVTVEIVSSKADKALAKIYADTFRELSAGDENGSHLTLVLRARQASETAKLDYIEESVREITDEGRSAAVFCNFNATVDALKERLSDLKPAVIRGGQKAHERETERLRFQGNKTPVILCNLASGGVSLDLHDVNGKPRYSLILPSWSAVDLKQALGRIHRAGSQSDAVQRIIYSDVEVEKRIAEVVREKLHALDTLHDSDTGIEKIGGKKK